MILIRQIPAPKALLTNQAKWTARWRGGQPEQWATEAARKLLQLYLPLKSHGKCVYCESVLGTSARPEIEHYHAKTVEQELAFEWGNFFLACGYCNNTKRHQPHDGALLKPDVDDGETHLWFNPDTGELEPSPGSDSARFEATRRLCDLNRHALRRARIKQFHLAVAILEAIRQRDSLPRKLRSVFLGLLARAAEYKLAIRSALPPRLAGIDRRMYHAAD